MRIKQCTTTHCTALHCTEESEAPNSQLQGGRDERRGVTKDKDEERPLPPRTGGREGEGKEGQMQSNGRGQTKKNPNRMERNEDGRGEKESEKRDDEQERRENRLFYLRLFGWEVDGAVNWVTALYSKGNSIQQSKGGL